LDSGIVMDCYFGSYSRGEAESTQKEMLVCFSIPSAGIAFKAPFCGEELHSNYASLLTLLEFIDLNRKLFKGRHLKIYSDSLELIKQIRSNTCRLEFTELLRKVLEYKKKLSWSIDWIPKNDNPSVDYLFD